MKYLHIIQLNERNTYNLYKQFYKVFNMDEHVFFVMNKKSNLKNFPKFKEFDKFVYLPEKNIIKKLIMILKYFFSARNVIFNSLLFNNNKYIYLYSFLSILKKNIYWVEWGGDLYNWKRPSNTLTNIIMNIANYNLRRRMKGVGVTTECDDVEVQKQFSDRKPILYTPLPFGEDRFETLDRVMSCVNYDDNSINIQIAHNSLSINNHLEIIALISKYSENDIKVFFPLSYGVFGIGGQYGGKKYLKSVINMAKKTFGEKVVIMSKGMPLEKYLEHLWGIDIAIFGSERPIGMANILYLLYMNKKVFLHKSTPLYTFLKRKGIDIYAIEDIPNMSFDEFITPVPVKEINPWVRNKFVPSKEIKEWEKFFKFIEAN